MEKPFSVKVKDLKDDMVSLVNNAGLPLFMVEPIVRDILVAVQTKVEQQYLQDKAAYEQSLVDANNEPAQEDK